MYKGWLHTKRSMCIDVRFGDPKLFVRLTPRSLQRLQHCMVDLNTL